MTPEQNTDLNFIDLKTAREKAGLSLKDVFERTRISVGNLEAIENGDFHLLPVPIYTRNFIKTYAESLGVDSKSVLQRYENYLQALQMKESAQKTEPNQMASVGSVINRYKVYLWIFCIFIVFVAVSLLVSLYNKPQPEIAEKPEVKKETVVPSAPLSISVTPENKPAIDLPKQPEAPLVVPSPAPVTDANKLPETRPDAKPDTKQTPQPEVKTPAKPDLKSEAKPQTKVEAKQPLTTQKPVLATVPEGVKPAAVKPTEVKKEVKPESKLAIKPDTKTAVRPDIKTEVKPPAKPDLKAEAKPLTKTETKPVVTNAKPALPAAEAAKSEARKVQALVDSEESSLMVIRATEETWVRIKADNQEAFQVLLKPGDKISHKGARFQMDIGNAAGVKINFNGKSFENLGKTGQVIHLRLP